MAGLKRRIGRIERGLDRGKISPREKRLLWEERAKQEEAALYKLIDAIAIIEAGGTVSPEYQDFYDNLILEADRDEMAAAVLGALRDEVEKRRRV